MAPLVDYSKLSRRELQVLCKAHKIPANKTNVFMAEALDALLNNAPRQQEEFQEEEIPAPDSPEVEKVVERVKGKQESKTVLLPEPELDSLADLLANSSLSSSVNEEMSEQAAAPDRCSGEPVISRENTLPLAHVVVVPKARRGRPRKAVDQPMAESIVDEERSVDANTNVPQVMERGSKFQEMMEQAAGAELNFPLAPVVAAKSRRGRPRKKEEKVTASALAEAAEADESYIIPTADPSPEYGAEAMMEEAVGHEFQEKIVQAVDADFISEEPVPTENMLSPAPVVAPKARRGRLRKKEAALAQAVETDDCSVNSLSGYAGDFEMEESVGCNVQEVTEHAADAEIVLSEEPIPRVNILPLAPMVAPKARRGRKKEKVCKVALMDTAETDDNKVVAGMNFGENADEASMEESCSWPKTWTQAALEASVVLSDAVEEPTRTVSSPDVETVATEFEVPAENVEQVYPESTSADYEPVKEDTAGKSDADEAEEIVLCPVEKKKSRKGKKGTKYRRNAEVEVEEVEARCTELYRDLAPEEASDAAAAPTDSTRDLGDAERSFSWTCPPSVLEEELPPMKKAIAFTISPSIPKEKKSRKKVMATKKNMSADQDLCNATAENEKDQTEDTKEPVTPVKNAVAPAVGGDKENEKDALLSLSMRKLVKKCKEKGLRARENAMNRSIKL